MAKIICWIQHKKKKRNKKKMDKDGKALYKLINNAAYEKKNEKKWETVKCKTSKQQKRLFKWTTKPNFKSQKYSTIIS